MPAEMRTYFIRALISSGLENSSFKPRTASNGMVNSAMTRIDDTARNLAYIGT